MRTFSGAAPGNFHKSRKPAQILGFPVLRRSQPDRTRAAGKVEQISKQTMRVKMCPSP
nr:MAG TPA: hypothetical protein [Caudoviricetes sp.]